MDQLFKHKNGIFKNKTIFSFKNKQNTHPELSSVVKEIQYFSPYSQKNKAMQNKETSLFQNAIYSYRLPPEEK